MMKDLGLCGVGVDDREEPGFVQKHADIVHSAAVLLEKCQLIKYNLMMIYTKHLNQPR